MNIFAIDLTPGEISLLRQSLDLITITGKDAKFVASLQIKLESELEQINTMMSKDSQKKKQELDELVAHEVRKTAKASAPKSE
jgi:hypothetical protein